MRVRDSTRTARTVTRLALSVKSGPGEQLLESGCLDRCARDVEVTNGFRKKDRLPDS